MTNTGDHFDRQAQAYAESAPKVLRETLQAVARLLPYGGSALDVGAGTGLVSRLVARQLDSVVSFDVSGRMLSVGLAEAGPEALDRLVGVRGSASSLPFPDASFDLVTSQALLHHVADPATVLAEMARVSAALGQIIISDMIAPADPALAALQNRLESTRDPTHVQIMTYPTLARILTELGFSIGARVNTRVSLELEDWLDRAGTSATAAEALRVEFVDLDRTARDAFAVRVIGDTTTFRWPMIVLRASRQSPG